MSYQNRFFTQNLHQLKHQLKNQIGMNKDLPFEEMCTHINYTFRIFMKSVQLEYWYFKVDTQGSQLDNSLLFCSYFVPLCVATNFEWGTKLWKYRFFVNILLPSASREILTNIIRILKWRVDVLKNSLHLKVDGTYKNTHKLLKVLLNFSSHET